MIGAASDEPAGRRWVVSPNRCGLDASGDCGDAGL